jgi:hypothetical protein
MFLIGAYFHDRLRGTGREAAAAELDTMIAAAIVMALFGSLPSYASLV